MKATNNNPYPTVYIMVGLPASGKSTFAKTIEPAVFLNSDKIRAEGHYGHSKEGNSATFSKMKRRLFNALRRNCNVIYDATNVIKGQRKELLAEIKRNFPNARKACVFMNTPYEMCVERNSKRDSGFVPLRIMEHMLDVFTAPTKDEGYDELKTVYPDGRMETL